MLWSWFILSYIWKSLFFPKNKAPCGAGKFRQMARFFGFSDSLSGHRCPEKYRNSQKSSKKPSKNRFFLKIGILGQNRPFSQDLSYLIFESPYFSPKMFPQLRGSQFLTKLTGFCVFWSSEPGNFLGKIRKNSKTFEKPVKNRFFPKIGILGQNRPFSQDLILSYIWKSLFFPKNVPPVGGQPIFDKTSRFLRFLIA